MIRSTIVHLIEMTAFALCFALIPVALALAFGNVHALLGLDQTVNLSPAYLTVAVLLPLSLVVNHWARTTLDARRQALVKRGLQGCYS